MNRCELAERDFLRGSPGLHTLSFSAEEMLSFIGEDYRNSTGRRRYRK